MKVNTKRIYDVYLKSDGYRILVDRLWPRGIKKEKAQIDTWMKDVAPSNELRKWFAHDPKKWQDFVSKYEKELAGSAAFHKLIEQIKKHKTVTLVFSAVDHDHNQAVALKSFIESSVK